MKFGTRRPAQARSNKADPWLPSSHRVVAAFVDFSALVRGRPQARKLLLRLRNPARRIEGVETALLGEATGPCSSSDGAACRPISAAECTPSLQQRTCRGSGRRSEAGNDAATAPGGQLATPCLSVPPSGVGQHLCTAQAAPLPSAPCAAAVYIVLLNLGPSPARLHDRTQPPLSDKYERLAFRLQPICTHGHPSQPSLGKKSPRTRRAKMAVMGTPHADARFSAKTAAFDLILSRTPPTEAYLGLWRDCSHAPGATV